MFIIVRLVIGCLFLCGAFMLIRKSRIAKKRIAYLLTVAFSFVLVSVLCLFPVEKAFLTYKTPESAFRYVNMQPDIKFTVYGENSCLIIGENSGANEFLIIPKSGNGWKIDVGKNTKMISQKVYDSIVICVYQHRNTGDCYISVLDTNGAAIQLSDNCNSSFMVSEKSVNALNKAYFRYYAYISDYDEDYQLVLNGRTYYL